MKKRILRGLKYQLKVLYIYINYTKITYKKLNKIYLFIISILYLNAKYIWFYLYNFIFLKKNGFKILILSCYIKKNLVYKA